MKKPVYETVYILRGDISEAGSKRLAERVTDLIRNHQGNLVSLKDLGARPLAYRIKKQTRGHYFQFNYEGPGALVNDVERTLRLSEEVLRFLTVKADQAGLERSRPKEAR